ncbi:MAG TPA: polysaccharide biosynthesis/export family protein [Myxococcaceae bacterium]|nr:polysaccharide biosynthesis/export family protein [Myxococcaceae bacterium]
MGRTNARWWGVLGLLLLSGCAHRAMPRVDNSDPPYRIGREDVLDVAVWRDAELSRTLPVRPDGFISLPMVGEVRAEGRTPPELAEEIRQALTVWLQEPRVTVIVREVNSSRVFVTGEVARPGAYPLRGRVSILQAITLAGGLTDFADRDDIIIIRAGVEGGRILVRYAELLEPGKAGQLLLRSGDTVIVP